MKKIWAQVGTQISVTDKEYESLISGEMGDAEMLKMFTSRGVVCGITVLHDVDGTEMKNGEFEF